MFVSEQLFLVFANVWSEIYKYESTAIVTVYNSSTDDDLHIVFSAYPLTIISTFYFQLTP